MAMNIKMLTQLTETPPHSIWTEMKQIVMHSTAMMPRGPWPLHSTGPSLVRLCVCLLVSRHTSNVQSTVLAAFTKDCVYCTKSFVLQKYSLCEGEKNRDMIQLSDRFFRA